MNYYTCAAVAGDMGTTAAVPAGVGWAGSCDAASGTYLIATRADLTGVQGVTAVTDLAAECASRGLALADVESWRC